MAGFEVEITRQTELRAAGWIESSDHADAPLYRRVQIKDFVLSGRWLHLVPCTSTVFRLPFSTLEYNSFPPIFLLIQPIMLRKRKFYF